jgi:hypothetical protein
MGKPGKIMSDILMAVMQIGFCVGMVYFVVTSLKECFDEWVDSDVNIIYFGNQASL